MTGIGDFESNTVSLLKILKRSGQRPDSNAGQPVTKPVKLRGPSSEGHFGLVHEQLDDRLGRAHCKEKTSYVSGHEKLPVGGHEKGLPPVLLTP